MNFHKTPKLFCCNPCSFRTLFPSSDAFRKNWRILGPLGQIFVLVTTSKEEGSGYTITSPILIVLLAQHSYSEA